MITIIGANNCTYCKLAKEYLHFKEIQYNYVNYKEFPQFKKDKHLTVPQIYYRENNGSYSMLTKDGYNGLLELSLEKLRGLRVNIEDEDYGPLLDTSVALGEDKKDVVDEAD